MISLLCLQGCCHGKVRATRCGGRGGYGAARGGHRVCQRPRGGLGQLHGRDRAFRQPRALHGRRRRVTWHQMGFLRHCSNTARIYRSMTGSDGACCQPRRVVLLSGAESLPASACANCIALEQAACAVIDPHLQLHLRPSFCAVPQAITSTRTSARAAMTRPTPLEAAATTPTGPTSATVRAGPAASLSTLNPLRLQLWLALTLAAMCCSCFVAELDWSTCTEPQGQLLTFVVSFAVQTAAASAA